jgi:glycosyltransferase involved in cell wall biosynthesis
MTPSASPAAELPPRLPTLSVVMPNYNHGRYLEAALRAHLYQTVPPLEIIVVDDASTDESCALVERLADRHPSVRLIRLERNSGVNAATNWGLREARGDYVCLSAADDLVSPDFAARSLQALAQHPEAGFCFSDVAVMLGDSGAVRRYPLFISRAPRMLSPLEMEEVLRRYYFNFPSHSILYRRDALLAVGGFREDLHWIADWFANHILAFRHGVYYVPRVLAFFRLTPDSYSARGSRQTGVQRDLLYHMLDLLESDAFRDLADPFRRSAIVPELHPRVLLWLLASAAHRSYLTPRLAGRLVFRGAWAVLKPYLPDWLRGAIRWTGAIPRRRRLTGSWPGLTPATPSRGGN